MLVRFALKNLFSFKEYTEFNMVPGRFSRIPHHVHQFEDIGILKLSAIYGANGAGKSNMIQAIALLQRFVTTGSMPAQFITQTFKFDKSGADKDVYLGVEFIKENVPYYYGITINRGIITEEELQITGLGKQEDRVLFIRTDSVAKRTLSLKFSEETNADNDAAQFRSFMENEMLERNKPVLYYMKNRKNVVFEPFKRALEWIDKQLVILLPDTRPAPIAHFLEEDMSLREFLNTTMKTLGTGITDISVEQVPIEKYFGEDNKQEADRITAELRAHPGMDKVSRNNFEDVVFTLENNSPVAKKLVFTHGENDEAANFHSYEESDGTRKLMHLLPAIYTIIATDATFVIDEIERSIHPLLIKELISKFSNEKEAEGQLIFSTHESNLLDQEIFRPDEIWFTEKNKEGATEIYALSEFKEHHTLDIRKGYLNGRYGAIPFLGNLKDLNWNNHAETN